MEVDLPTISASFILLRRPLCGRRTRPAQDPDILGVSLSVITKAAPDSRRHPGAMDASISTSSSTHRQYSSIGFVYTLLVINVLIVIASCRPPGADSQPSSGGDATSLLDAHGDNSPLSGSQADGNVADSPHQPDLDSISPHFAEHGEQETSQPHEFQFTGEIIPNVIPVNPDDHDDVIFPDFGDAGSVDQDIKKPAAPKYMVELYNKYTTDRYIHPVTNIVRSYMNINEDTPVAFPSFGNRTRVHILVFNITSISLDEDIYMSELRLYKLVQADRSQFLGVNRHVSVHELVYDTDVGNATTFVAEKNLYGPHSGWETFSVTEAVKRWVQTGLPWQSQILEIRIDSVDGESDNADVDFDTRPHNENEPLLVVFSNDKKKKKTETRELHEMITHELDMYNSFEEIEDAEYNEIDENYDDYYDYEYDMLGHDFAPDNIHDLQKRDTSSNFQPRSKLLTERSGKIQAKSNIQDSHTKIKLENLYKSILSLDEGNSDETGIGVNNTMRLTKRSNKNKKKRRRGKRRFCRRRPLYVDFHDINWHTWIIAPRGYQAFQCSGRCDFPLSDHLTPTKHAIVQTLVHANYAGVRRRHKTEPVCCVPTKLEPISILYIDDKGTVTYKYDYDDMVVTECGCR